MPDNFDSSIAADHPDYRVRRINAARAPAALALLASLAEHEKAVLPPAFAADHAGHQDLLSYLGQAPAGHWHLGLSASPPPSAALPWQGTRKPGSSQRLQDEALLGLVSGFLIPDPLDELPAAQGSQGGGAGPALFINSLVIDQSKRGQGLGAHALQLIGRLAAARGAQRAYIAISLHNPGARDFYRRQGARACELGYWSLCDAALDLCLQDLQAAPTPLYRPLEASSPGLVSLRGLAGPPLDMAFGFDFGLARYEVWLQTAPQWDLEQVAIAHTSALRQLRLWVQDRSPSRALFAPQIGLTGLSASLPDNSDPVDASVWMLPLSR